MPVLPVACLRDNFAYLLYHECGGEAVVVDPSEPKPVLAVLSQLGLRLSAILLTHHHWDHVGGVPGLLDAHSSLPVYASVTDARRIDCVTHTLVPGELVATPVGDFETIAVPGHTLGAVTYLWEEAAFTGDTLFGGGCGRLFEGTAAQLCRSLQSIAALPGATSIYSGHEYTLQNLAFAAHLEPDNVAIAERIARETAKVAAGDNTVPSTVELEQLTNPFLRCDEPTIRRTLSQPLEADTVSVFAEMRQLKDNFRA